MTSVCPYETIELLGISLEVPRDWQIVRHGLDERKGGLTFTDRSAERMTFHWNTLEREPDIARMLQTEWGKSKQTGESSEFREETIDEWRGFRFDDARGTWLRAVRYDSSSRRLLEVALALETAHSRSRAVDRRLLSRVELKKSELACRFLAFDIDVTYPSDFVVTKCEVVPASVTLHLESRAPFKRFGAVDSILIRRMGMARTWYRGNALALLARENPLVDPRKANTREIHGHPGAAARTTLSRPLQRWFGHGRTLGATLWHCDEENAVYHVATRTADGRPLDPDAVQVRCCKWAEGSAPRGDG
jgi:hypothetical protein